MPQRHIIFSILITVIGFFVFFDVASANPGDLVWRADIGSTGSYTDLVPDPDKTWPSLDGGSSRYIFTSVLVDGNIVYTARSYKGPWTNTGGYSIQRWDATTGELLASQSDCGCRGVYDMELKFYDDPDPDNPDMVRLYVYKPEYVDILDATGLNVISGGLPDTTAPLCNTACNDSATSPAAFNGSISKRTKMRGDGIEVLAKQDGTNPNYQMKLFLGATEIPMEPSTWITDIVPAPSWHTDPSSSRYFGVEAIALSPDHAYVYIVGGRENGTSYASRIEKRKLGQLDNPAVDINATPAGVLPFGGANITLEWSTVDADSCDIKKTDSFGTSIIYTETSGSEPVFVAESTTFYADCIRSSDSKPGSDNVTVPVALSELPTAVISAPPGDISIILGDPVNFIGDTSYDPEDDAAGLELTYDWREVNTTVTPGASCSTATSFSSAANPSYVFSTSGVYNIYLVVEDSDGGASGCAMRVITVPPQCSDGDDNDGDGDFDENDAGCHSDGNASNGASYDGTDDSEANCGDGICTKTSGESFLQCRLDCKIIFNTF